MTPPPPGLADALALRLADFRVGRITLHVAAFIHSRRNFCWHWECIRREFRLLRFPQP